jgi:hypothetical protein
MARTIVAIVGTLIFTVSMILLFTSIEFTPLRCPPPAEVGNLKDAPHRIAPFYT